MRRVGGGSAVAGCLADERVCCAYSRRREQGRFAPLRGQLGLRLGGSADRIRDDVFTPDGIFVDAHDNLYVTNGHMSGRESVEMYARGGHKPIAATDGTVYIADACGGPHTRGRVVYPPGKTKPSRSFFPGGAPYCLTLDAQNNLYVGYNSTGSYAQVKLPPTLSTFFPA